jgi:regulator of sirC expression with transglutaminase-like and TPR domain
VSLPSFEELAGDPQTAMDVLALSLAAEFRPVDADTSLGMLDVLAEDLSRAVARTRQRPLEVALACGQVLGRDHGFTGDRERYDHPDNSMLDLVLERGRGLPILLSVVYVEVARRAGIELAGVGLPGHFVVGHFGHFGSSPPLLLDPFAGGVEVEVEDPVRPWRPHEIALRMLNNLVGSYQRRGDVGRAIAAATMRLELPLHRRLRDALDVELRRLRARLN